MRIKELLKIKRFIYLVKFMLTIIVYLAFPRNLKAQESTLDKIVESFQNYSKAYREIAYCHLNKSTYIKGESIGFNAYVLNKDLKKPSKLTKNLYCVILDSTNTIVKSKLVKVDNGFSHNVFNLDSLFTSGEYTFKAYTNWMKNFDEPNIFIETFRVLDPMVQTSIKNKQIENDLDVQFLPEGGNFVNLAKTNVGVVIKNVKGYGVSNVKGIVYDINNKFITEFTTNTLGISRFLLYPEIGNSYIVKINHLNKSFEYVINNIEPKGVTIHVNKLKDKVVLEFDTNKQTIDEIGQKTYKLVTHNGKEIKLVNIQAFKKGLIILIDIKDLFAGINIFTLFNEKDIPILERLYFNFDGINFNKLEKPLYSKFGDSLKVSIPIESSFESDDDESTNVSISILPKSTNSYNRHQNLVSYTYLQPYVKGYIENAAYYFTNITRKKEYELDNLLITQGWSSYSWSNIFNKNTHNNFVFEDGIVIKANTNNTYSNSLIVYPLKKNEGYVVDLPEGEQSFLKAGFYPQENETLNFSVLNKKGVSKKANLYVQFSPLKRPSFINNYFKPIPSNSNVYIKAKSSQPFSLINLEELQKLEEVVIKADLRQTRIERFKGSSFTKIDVFDDTKRAMNLTLSNYINIYMNGFSASEQMGVLSISSRNIREFNNSPIVYLDDMLLNNYEFLINFDMSRVDYIAYDRHGFGEGSRGSGGVIKIFTSNLFPNTKQTENFRKFKFPLTFSENKKFYVPKYDLYNDDFFKEYGVIDWIPDCKLDKKGNLNFTIYNPGNNNLNFFIEGITSKGSIIIENKTLNLN